MLKNKGDALGDNFNCSNFFSCQILELIWHAFSATRFYIILNIFFLFSPSPPPHLHQSHRRSSAEQPPHHPKMARAQGAKNYRRPLLMELVNEFLPNGFSLWKAVAAEYQRRSGESEERDPREMEKYWRFKMCNNYKKPAGGEVRFFYSVFGSPVK